MKRRSGEAAVAAAERFGGQGGDGDQAEGDGGQGGGEQGAAGLPAGASFSASQAIATALIPSPSAEAAAPGRIRRNTG